LRKEETVERTLEYPRFRLRIGEKRRQLKEPWNIKGLG